MLEKVIYEIQHVLRSCPYYFMHKMTLLFSLFFPPFRVYASQEDCYAQRAANVLYLAYSGSSFLTEDGVPLYRCTTTSRESSYVYVCHGSNGIQKMEYAKGNCKGSATVVSQISFLEYCSGTKLTTLPTCMGPATF